MGHRPLVMAILTWDRSALLRDNMGAIARHTDYPPRRVRGGPGLDGRMKAVGREISPDPSQ